MNQQQIDNEKLIATMQAGIAELKNKPPPSIPLQYVLDAVQPPMKKMLEDEISSLIDGFTQEMQGIVHDRNKDYKNLWEKLGVTQKMVTAIAHQVEREQAGLAGPIKAAVPPTL